MPTVKEWKAKNKTLNDEIVEFQKNPDLKNPYNNNHINFAESVAKVSENARICVERARDT